MMLKFGKYKGKTYKEIANLDIKYLINIYWNFAGKRGQHEEIGEIEKEIEKIGKDIFYKKNIENNIEKYMQERKNKENKAFIKARIKTKKLFKEYRKKEEKTIIINHGEIPRGSFWKVIKKSKITEEIIEKEIEIGFEKIYF